MLTSRPVSVPGDSPSGPPDLPSALKPLASLGSLRSWARGAYLFHQGQPVDAVYQLRSGCVRLQRVTADGAEVTLHTAQPGEWFAEAALFSTHYHCDAVALTDSQLLRLPRAALRECLHAQPELLWAFSAELARRVQGLRMRLTLHQTRGAKARILHDLRLRADHRGCFRPAGTLKHWASELGLTHEALYRALAALEREGRLLRRGAGQFELLTARADAAAKRSGVQGQAVERPR